MDIHQLLYFVRAVEKPSFAQAADTLFISRAALSKSISKLESEVGCELFERTRDGVHLTSSGELFYSKAIEVVRAYEELLQTIGTGQCTCTLTLGISISHALAFLDAIEHFRATHPNANLILRSLLDPDGQQALDDGTVDMFISSFPMHGTVDDGLDLFTTPLHIVMSENCPLAQLDTISSADMREYGIVYYTSGYSKFDWAPVIEGRRVLFENDIMLAYSRVARDGMLFPVPLTAIPGNLSDITSRPYRGSIDSVVLRGYIGRHVRNRNNLEALAVELREALVIGEKR